MDTIFVLTAKAASISLFTSCIFSLHMLLIPKHCHDLGKGNGHTAIFADERLAIFRAWPPTCVPIPEEETIDQYRQFTQLMNFLAGLREIEGILWRAQANLDAIVSNVVQALSLTPSDGAR